VHCFEQAKKCRETSDEYDDVDDDFSDEEITEEQMASVMNRAKTNSDTVSTRSDIEDDDVAAQQDKLASTLKQLMQSVDTISHRVKNDRPKVRAAFQTI